MTIDEHKQNRIKQLGEKEQRRRADIIKQLKQLLGSVYSELKEIDFLQNSIQLYFSNHHPIKILILNNDELDNSFFVKKRYNWWDRFFNKPEVCYTNFADALIAAEK